MAGNHWIKHMRTFERLMYEPGDANVPQTWTCFDIESERKFTVAWKPYSTVLPSFILREVSALGQLTHENIVRLDDVKSTNEGAYLIFEHLYDSFFQNSSRMLDAMEYVKCDLFQALRGVSYFHSRKYIHRNLTPENIQLDVKDTLKITGFHYAVKANGPLTDYPDYEVNTIKYKAPEELLELPYTSAVDIWSLGVIFSGVIVGEPLFNGTTPNDVVKNTIKALGMPLETEMQGIASACVRVCSDMGELSNAPRNLEDIFKEHGAPDMSNLKPHGLDLLSKMLSVAPSKRISAEEALEHPYFNDFGASVLASVT